MALISISQAMKAIKDEKCCECGKKAKGLIYRGRDVSYYCKDCLHEYTDQKETQVEEAVAS